MSARTARTVLLVAALLAVLGAAGIYALASSFGEDSTAEVSAASKGISSELRAAVNPDGILEHARRFQAIADEHGGNRAAGSPGYDASAGYVADTLREAGYGVTVQRFEVPDSADLRDATLDTEGREYVRETDFVPMEGSGGGDVESALRPVDAGGRTSGCEAGDFSGFSDGAVALMRRGTCSFAGKVANAEAAGAAAAVIFNEGASGDGEVLRGTLGDSDASIPVLGTSAEVGEELLALADDGAEARVSVAGGSGNVSTTNVIAETRGGDAGNTVMVGAHLDSVPQGPGINDNGSGSATVLEIAQEMARMDAEPRNRVRFAFWGAEELGLIGSRHYVDELGNDELDDISAYLNFDMVGSPNFVRSVYEGPDEVEDVFDAYFERRGIEVSVNSALDGRSDHGPFADEGIPTGGLFSGAGGTKSEAQARAFGGEAGEAYDECYHQACDDIDNLNERALDQLSDGAAHATAVLANASDP